MSVEVRISREEVEAALTTMALLKAGGSGKVEAEFDWSDFSDNDRVTVSWTEVSK